MRFRISSRASVVLIAVFHVSLQYFRADGAMNDKAIPVNGIVGFQVF
jgi:hypothetical protein